MTAPPEDGGGRVARTHERAVLQQDNGEVQEDVVATHVLDESIRRAGEGAEPRVDDERNSRVDEESEQSFPASDPPSHWATGGNGHHGSDSDQGPDSDQEPDSAGGRRDVAHGRVVERSPVEHVDERARPGDPVPKTLPR